MRAESKRQRTFIRADFPPDNPSVPLEHWSFTGDTVKEAKKNFKSVVEKVLVYKAFNDTQKEWIHSVDYHSIRAVFNILPDEFERRIRFGYFDKSLLDGVKGGDYVVPLYYYQSVGCIVEK